MPPSAVITEHIADRVHPVIGIATEFAGQRFTANKAAGFPTVFAIEQRTVEQGGKKRKAAMRGNGNELNRDDRDTADGRDRSARRATWSSNNMGGRFQ